MHATFQHTLVALGIVLAGVTSTGVVRAVTATGTELMAAFTLVRALTLTLRGAHWSYRPQKKNHVIIVQLLNKSILFFALRARVRPNQWCMRMLLTTLTIGGVPAASHVVLDSTLGVARWTQVIVVVLLRDVSVAITRLLIVYSCVTIFILQYRTNF